VSAFILIDKEKDYFEESLLNPVMDKMGLKAFCEHSSTNWRVFSWASYHNDGPNYYQLGDAWMVLSGCPIYKNTSSIKESALMILQSLQEQRFDFKDVRGNYSFFYVSPSGQESLYIDPSGISNCYFNADETCISSSFLGLIFGTNNTYRVNRFATAEVLVNGRLIGPDTLLEGVYRLELHLKKSFNKLVVKTDYDALRHPEIRKIAFQQAVEEQLQLIHDFFADVREFALNNKVDTGVTGGHDSRIILSNIRKQVPSDKFQIHSFWRKNKDTELKTAELVAKSVGKELISVPAKHPFEMDYREMEVNLEESLLFYDGHVRMHCFYTEQYHTLTHRLQILNDKRLGFNGVGGEQYRNEWHMERQAWSFDYFIRHFLVYHISGRSFTNARFEQDFFDYLSAKVNARLHRKGSEKSISRVEVQQYLNEIYVCSLMGARTNAENKVTTFLTPFIDRQLTRGSYHALPHHGISFGFQQEMIRQLDPELAAVESGYGYPFSVGESLKHRIKYLIKEAVPTSIYQSRLEKLMKSKGNDQFNEFLKHFPVLQQSVDLLRQFQIPIDEHLVTCYPDIMPVYLSASYFFHYLHQNGKLEK